MDRAIISIDWRITVTKRRRLEYDRLMERERDYGALRRVASERVRDDRDEWRTQLCIVLMHYQAIWFQLIC